MIEDELKKLPGDVMLLDSPGNSNDIDDVQFNSESGLLIMDSQAASMECSFMLLKKIVQPVVIAL